jgi:3-oxoacyl-(acyl-carrier-protein) synthase
MIERVVGEMSDDTPAGEASIARAILYAGAMIAEALRDSFVHNDDDDNVPRAINGVGSAMGDLAEAIENLNPRSLK